jgi:hypothetical protein
MLRRRTIEPGRRHSPSRTEPRGRGLLSVITPLGLAGWAVLGAAASFAIWELGDFAIDTGGALERAGREAPRPMLSRPDAKDGCSQARIDRRTGQTVIAECPARPSGTAARAAWLEGRTSSP